MNRYQPNFFRSTAAALLLLINGCAGCTDSSAPTVAANSTKTELWDVLFMHDSRVGYAHTEIFPFEEDGQRLVKIDVTNELTLKRFGELSTQTMKVTSVETPAGEVQHISSRISAGREETVVGGIVRGNQLTLSTKSTGKTVETRLIWKNTFGGYFAAEQSLRERPMKPGETRSFKALAAGVNQLEDVRLQALDYEETKLLNETRQLLKIRKSELIGPTKIDSFLWVDDKGETLKTHLPGMELVSYRTTKELALKAGKPIAFDLGDDVVVKLHRPLTDPHAAKRIVYRATMKNGEIANVFAESASQQVEKIDERTAQLTVIALRPDQPSTVIETESPPTEADVASNNMIQCDNERIVALAHALAPDDADPWTVARAAESFVKRSMRQVNFSQALATAADVAKSLEGDCTEHAVLVAALCRARKIPARVAVGLVCYREKTNLPYHGLAYHMWNEVWIKDRWIPLDGTLGRGGIGGGHVKLGTSSLDAKDSFNVFLPLANVVGNLELEIVEDMP